MFLFWRANAAALSLLVRATEGAICGQVSRICCDDRRRGRKPRYIDWVLYCKPELSPWTGWMLGVPFLTRRTWSTAPCLEGAKIGVLPLAKYEKFPRMFILRGTRELNKGKRAALSLPQTSARAYDHPPAVICYRFSDEEAVSMNVTTRYLLAGLLAAATLLPAAPGGTQPQRVAYPEVKVVLENPYKPDAAFDKMNGAFLDAVQRKDVGALTALVAPTFLWTVSDHPAGELDLGRDAIHNFKVAFGFRALGEGVDGGVDDGPYWDLLTAFAEEVSFYIANDAGTLVCGPMTAEVADENAFEEARRKINAIDEPIEWYFTVAAETPVAMAPGDSGTPVAKVGTIAMPLIGFYPPEREGAPPPPPSHYEVLLPSGRTGWVPVTAVRPLKTDHLCYARTPAGEWKIASIDQAEGAP